MKIAIGADHAGYAMKERFRERLRERGHELVDLGTTSDESTDYPDFAAAVARKVAEGECDRGLLFCSTGTGMVIAANKVPGVRAALAVDSEEVRLARGHNDANVLAVGARFTDPETVDRMIELFLNTAFEGGRHARRVAKIADLERRAAGESKE